MKLKKILALAFMLMTQMQYQTTIAQLRNPITYDVIREDATEIYCKTNYLVQESTLTLSSKLEIHVVDDSLVSLAFSISTITNESIVKIARTLKDESKLIYATYTLSNKEKIMLDTYGYDSTREGLKDSKSMGGFYFFSIFVQEGKLSPATVAKFRTYDIETINFGSGVIDVKKTLGINTASIINSMCKKLMENGVNAEVLGENYVVDSKSKGGATSSSLSTSKNISAIDLIRYPFGVLDGNLKDQSVASIVQTAKQRLKAEVSYMELDTFYSLNVYDFQGYDLNLYNKNITNASIFIFKSQKLRWDYSIRFKRSQYISKDVINYAKRIINEIKGTGFKLYPNSTSNNFPFGQLMSKGTLFVEVQVQDDPQFDEIIVNIRVQPDGNDY